MDLCFIMKVMKTTTIVFAFAITIGNNAIDLRFELILVAVMKTETLTTIQQTDYFYLFYCVHTCIA